MSEMMTRRERRAAAKAAQRARCEFARSLQERFAAEHITETTEAAEGSEDMLAALYGVCRCGSVFRRRTMWTLTGDTITGRTDAACANGHSVSVPFDRHGTGWMVMTEMGRVIYGMSGE